MERVCEGFSRDSTKRGLTGLWRDLLVLSTGPPRPEALPVLVRVKEWELGSGTVKEIDVGSSGDCFGKFLCIRILVDILKPLCRVLKVSLDEDNQEHILLLMYERLPEHCFHYGLIGHSFRECLKPGMEDTSVDESAFAFGSWLRASSPL
ncbi:hypothetical protein ACOSQ3_027936 [Xanthoceras sorbifolium]